MKVKKFHCKAVSLLNLFPIIVHLIMQTVRFVKSIFEKPWHVNNVATVLFSIA